MSERPVLRGPGAAHGSSYDCSDARACGDHRSRADRPAGRGHRAARTNCRASSAAAHIAAEARGDRGAREAPAHGRAGQAAAYGRACAAEADLPAASGQAHAREVVTISRCVQIHTYPVHAFIGPDLSPGER